MGLIRKFQTILPRFSLLTIYKTFARPHLDYGDMIYDQTYNALFHRKLESIQYSACLANTGTIRGNLDDGLGNDVCSTKLSITNHLLTCLTIVPVLTEYITQGMQLMFQG